MELLLNSIWLVIALGSVCVWRGVWRRGKTPSRREWVALATLLFLLFPVISLTDDLHEELAVAECSTGTKHFLTSACRSSGHQNGAHASRLHGAAIWKSGLIFPVLEGVALNVLEVRVEIFRDLNIVPGRAPPQIPA